MKEELTTLMHWEFIGDEIPLFDMKIMDVYGAIRRGISKQQALAKWNISEKDYDDNIDRVLHT